MNQEIETNINTTVVCSGIKTANIIYKFFYQFYRTCKAHDTCKTANIFASVMGLGYNKIVLYPRRITLAKHICGFIGHKPYTIDKTGKVFYI